MLEKTQQGRTNMTLAIPIQFPICTSLIDRNIQDKILNLAVLTNEHVLFCGAPGTAKTLQANLFFGNFAAEFFSVQLSKFSTEEILFGPLNVTKLREGIIEYLYENSILTCNFALIDEIFDASDVLLRTLLGILNERKFCKGSFQLNVPLITAVATANYTRINEITAAVVDRFLFQYIVEPVRDKTRLLDFEIPSSTHHIDLPLLRAKQQIIPQVKLLDEYRQAYVKICENLNFTDRRLKKGIAVIKASAILEDRNEIIPEDFQNLRFLVGMDKTKIGEAEVFINQIIGNTRIRNDQYTKINKIKEQWGNCGSNHNAKTHLLVEMNLLRQLKQISPIDDIISQCRDECMNNIYTHFEKNRIEYIEKLKVRDLLNAGDLK